MKNKIFVVIPAYNEGDRIGNVILKAKSYISDIVVVDDGSNDSTYDAARKHNVTVLKHIINLGKGAALKTGCDYAIKKGADIIITLDADGQHTPEKIPLFINSLNDAEIVFGYRRLDNNMPVVLKFGNWFISKMIRLLYGLDLRDTQCGYRAFIASVYYKIRWRASDYSMESEMIANVGKYHLSYKELPIETIYTDKYKGTTIIDGIRIVFNLFLWRLRG